MAQYLKRRGGFLTAVLAVGLVLGAATAGSSFVHAQIMGDLPTMTTYRLAPVTVAPGETLRVVYSNVFGDTPTVLSVRFVNADDGTLVGALKDAVVEPGKGTSADFVADSELVVIAVVFLAEPRPDPLLSVQLIVNGSAAWLAEPRPDPILMK